MQHLNKQSGFVLFSVLILMFIAVSLLLIMMDSSETEFTMANNFYQQQKMLNKINSEIRTTYQDVPSQAIRCQISVTSSYALKHEPISFWNSSSACQKNNFNYVIEALSVDACVTIDKIHAAQFYRITGRETNSEGSLSLLQTVYSANSSAPVKCRSVIKQISEGQQSWRML